MDETFRKLIRPMDANGLRGVFSRGKPIYGGVKHHPKMGKLMKNNRPEFKTFDYQKAIRERFSNVRD